MKTLFKAITLFVLLTVFASCKKDDPDIKAERMWYWDDCKILRFKRHSLQYEVSYNDQGYPSKVSAQYPNINTVYDLSYVSDQLVEVKQFDHNKIVQKTIYRYSGNKITSIHLFGPIRDVSKSKIDTIELKRVEFKYEASEKPTSYIMYAFSEYITRDLLPFVDSKHIYDPDGNVGKIEWRSYIGGELVDVTHTINVYYDGKLSTGKFLNLLFFSFTEDSPAILFSDHNWLRSYVQNSGSTPDGRQISIEYDEHGNVKNCFYGFTDIEWKCD